MTLRARSNPELAKTNVSKQNTIERPLPTTGYDHKTYKRFIEILLRRRRAAKAGVKRPVIEEAIKASSSIPGAKFSLGPQFKNRSREGLLGER